MEGGRRRWWGEVVSFLEKFPSCRDASRKQRCNAPIDNMPTRQPLSTSPSSSLHRHLPRRSHFPSSVHPSILFVHQNLGEDPDDFSCGRETTYKSYIYIYTIIYDIYDIYIDFKSFKRKIRSKMETSKEREYDNNWPRLCFEIVSVIAYTRESGKFVCLFGRRYREGEREKKFESATKTFGELGIRRAVAKAWPILLAD